MLKDIPHQRLKGTGWNTRGYLPHFDGEAIPQFITLKLVDAIPLKVIDRWKRELEQLSRKEEQILMQRRIDAYLDQGYGSCYLKDPQIAAIVEKSLLDCDGIDYELFAWVVMPNHTHSLLKRFEDRNIPEIMDAHKGYTAHQANELLNQSGQFWMEDYFDRYIRNEKHFWNTVRYIENNPVKARLCKKPEDWPFSSAWFRKHGRKQT
ncbi:MAG TPA: transposase [Pyrinomonadaceae bacterium]